jgi:hypothetical protein
MFLKTRSSLWCKRLGGNLYIWASYWPILSLKNVGCYKKYIHIRYE